MKPVRRHEMLVVSIALAVVCGACGGDDGAGQGRSGPSESYSAPPPEPGLEPVEAASPVDEVPAPIAEVASSERVLEVSEGPRTRTGAEQFALDFAQLYIDARPDTDIDAVLEEVASEDLAPEIREYIVVDLTTQEQLGTERHWDAGRTQWLRSVVEPTSGDLDRVGVEIAAGFETPDFGEDTWYKVRVDVVWEEGQWKVKDLGAGDIGPYTSDELTPQQRREYLTGPGWRRIAPS